MQITKEFLREYKTSELKQFAISFIYDAKNKRTLPVPRDKCHAEYVATILGVEEESLDGNAHHLIPFSIGFSRKEGKLKLVGLLVGLSSLENEHDVKHSRQDVLKALKQAHRYISQSNLEKTIDYREAHFTNK